VDVDAVTIGQYLRPTRSHEPVHRYVPPEAFRDLEAKARALGFPTVYSGVFVRSSFNAEEVWKRREGGLHA
jgi:lipoic acid synthetase